MYVCIYYDYMIRLVVDRLAKEAANAGIDVEVDVPRAFTRRLAKEQMRRV